MTRLHVTAARLCAFAAGCASAPATRLHSLLTADARAASAAPALAWQLAPVTMPAQVDRPQLVVRAADDSLVVLEQERWIAPLADEMHAAIAERLVQRFGLGAAGTPLRVRVEVQRFDSVPGRRAPRRRLVRARRRCCDARSSAASRRSSRSVPAMPSCSRPSSRARHAWPMSSPTRSRRWPQGGRRAALQRETSTHGASGATVRRAVAARSRALRSSRSRRHAFELVRIDVPRQQVPCLATLLVRVD